jgi:hypothetical protein
MVYCRELLSFPWVSRRARQRLSMHSSRPFLERVEERCLLNTDIVTNLNDSGPGSLRQAIAGASPEDTVEFQPGLSGTITLTSPVTINDVLTIKGPGPDPSVITVSSKNAQEVFIIPAQFSVAISEVTIANANTGGNSLGGGVSNNGHLTITDCTFSDNFSAGGGAIYNGGNMDITGSTFTDNQATDVVGPVGGAVFNGGTLNITSSTFSKNMASGGGAIYNVGTLNITSSTFSGNVASNGGAINNNGNGKVTIATCTFSLNSAVTGAGISHTSNGTLSLASSTLSANFASSQGGGIFLQTDSGKTVIYNTIIAGNSAPYSPDVSGALSSQGYNLIGDGTGSMGLVNGVNHDHVGNSASPIVPMLGTLGDNADGQAPFTMALLPGSPALNMGDPTQLGQPDERGVVRAGGVNIGAYQASASLFQITSVPAQVITGVPFDLTVTAVDEFGQVAIGYTGTINISSTDTDPQATPPFSYTFTLGDNGMHTFPGGVTLITEGTQTITATDQSSGVTGSASTTVIPAVDQFMLNVPASVTAGAPFDVTVTAEDSNGNTVPGYTGTVTFSSSDPYPGVLPASYTFTSSDEGMHTFSGGVTLFTAGAQTLTVQDTTDSSITGSATITVLASAATGLHLVAAPPTAIAGTAFNVTITAVDPYGNVDTAYAGTVTLTSSDRYPQPIVYAFSASDSGTHTFTTSLDTAGAQTLSAWDAANGSIRGSTSIAVDAAPASQFSITAPSTVNAGEPFDVVVTALDQYGNTATNYLGTVHFSSSDTDPSAGWPGDYTFVADDQGVHTFADDFTLVTAGPQTLTATDTANAVITGTATVTVQMGGGARGPGGAILSPIIEPITAVTTSGKVQPVQPVAAVDRVFASLVGTERRFQPAWHTKHGSSPELLGVILAPVP